MKTSLVVGRTGSFDEETGLFVLHGRYNNFGLSPGTVEAIAKIRDGFEINSTYPFMDLKLNQKDHVNFLNRYSLYTTSFMGFSTALSETRVYEQGIESLDEFLEPVVFQESIQKVTARRYVNSWLGLIPPGSVLKVILKQQGVSTKRSMLFATGVPPSEGGKMWLVTPHGFPWWAEQSKVVVDAGGVTDIEQSITNPNFLYMLIPHAVPMISGHRKLQEDEKNPRVLCYDNFNEANYLEEVDNFITRVVNNDGGVTVGAETLMKLYIEAQATGGSVSTVQDFGVDHALALPDDNEMW